MSRIYASLSGCVLVALMAASVRDATAQQFAQCAGDCDRDSVVTVDELLSGINIALGLQAVGQCAVFDTNRDSRVTVDEILAAVRDALSGCPTANESSVRASSSVVVSSLSTVIDFGRAGMGGTGAGGASRALPSAQISGCETFTCFLDGQLTGTEERCCFPGRFTVESFTCAFDDGFGGTVSRNGFFALETSAPALCSGFIPAGVTFTAEFDQFSVLTTDSAGNFSFVGADLFESFEATSFGCSQFNPDLLGLGQRGDGIRLLNGSMRVVSASSDGTFFDYESRTDELSADVISFDTEDDFGNFSCGIDAVLNGALNVSDFALETEFRQNFVDFSLVEVPQSDGSTLFDLNGVTPTDCLGDIGVSSFESIRIFPNNSCPVGGSLFVTLPTGTTSFVEYTAGGGVNVDFDDDGFFDESLASCEQLQAQECVLEDPQGVCTACNSTQECEIDLDCSPCQFGCSTLVSRCAPLDGLVACDDGVFGNPSSPSEQRNSLLPCTALDEWELSVAAGDQIDVFADTTDGATAADLCFSVFCGAFGFDGDDDFECTFPPPEFACPSASLTAPTAATCLLTVETCSETCSDSQRANYVLDVRVNGAPSALTLVRDDVSGS